MSNNIKVLYVDDEQINLMLFKANFKKKFDIITAESGKEGLLLLISILVLLKKILLTSLSVIGIVFELT